MPMKIPIYLKVAKDKKGYKVEASAKPNTTPIISKGYSKNTYHPTIFFGIELELPEDAFKQAEQIIAKIDYRKTEIVNVDPKTQTEIRGKINKMALDNLKE